MEQPDIVAIPHLHLHLLLYIFMAVVELDSIGPISQRGTRDDRPKIKIAVAREVLHNPGNRYANGIVDGQGLAQHIRIRQPAKV